MAGKKEVRHNEGVAAYRFTVEGDLNEFGFRYPGKIIDSAGVESCVSLFRFMKHDPDAEFWYTFAMTNHSSHCLHVLMRGDYCFRNDRDKDEDLEFLVSPLCLQSLSEFVKEKGFSNLVDANGNPTEILSNILRSILCGILDVLNKNGSPCISEFNICMLGDQPKISQIQRPHVGLNPVRRFCKMVKHFFKDSGVLMGKDFEVFLRFLRRHCYDLILLESALHDPGVLWHMKRTEYRDKSHQFFQGLNENQRKHFNEQVMSVKKVQKNSDWITRLKNLNRNPDNGYIKALGSNKTTSKYNYKPTSFFRYSRNIYQHPPKAVRKEMMDYTLTRSWPRILPVVHQKVGILHNHVIEILPRP